jgi:hypothetical protein
MQKLKNMWIAQKTPSTMRWDMRKARQRIYPAEILIIMDLLSNKPKFIVQESISHYHDDDQVNRNKSKLSWVEGKIS